MILRNLFCHRPDLFMVVPHKTTKISRVGQTNNNILSCDLFQTEKYPFVMIKSFPECSGAYISCYTQFYGPNFRRCPPKMSKIGQNLGTFCLIFWATTVLERKFWVQKKAESLLYHNKAFLECLKEVCQCCRGQKTSNPNVYP